MSDTKTKKTMVVFSGEMDKVLAAFVIANAAAAMGDDVTMFFTFWGLNALRRPEKVKVSGKSTLEKLFGLMMPRGPARLQLSRMNFAGAGSWMMKRAMAAHKVATVEEMIVIAKEQGVRLVACTMTMDVMGLRREELVDGVELAGAAGYLADADEANVNLFI